VKGLRPGKNSARRRGHLDQVLPKRQRLPRGRRAALADDTLLQRSRDDGVLLWTLSI
jgi:hypothetical protein